MILRHFVAAIAAVPLCGSSATRFSKRGTLEEQIEQENAIALQGVLNNIGPDGSQAPGASPGITVASPSTENPNYFYTWTRDSALTFKMLIDEFIHGNSDLKSHIEDYLKAQAILQTVSNPSGSLSSGRGLGEPKFYVNETRFNGNWGRPQRDGPALRATALITYAQWLLDNNGLDEAKEKVWPVVQNDLNYVAQYWNQTGFDLWEEVHGSSFFTTAVQHRALVEGSALAEKLGFSHDDYDSQAPNILCFLQTFWNGKYAVANTNTDNPSARTGIDANTVLTSLATFDPKAQSDDATFQPSSARALANLKVYVDSFRSIYSINARANKSAPVATGRYAEDVYFGGNPWYLTTLAVAEQLYDAVQQWNTIGSISITDVSLPFWQDVYQSAATGTYTKDNPLFKTLLNAVLKWADGFVMIANKYTPSSGALAEQYSRQNGTALSARDLTWSYASYVTMRAARRAATSNSPQVPSWGGDTANQAPTVCVASSVQGTYTPATAAGAPPGSGSCTVLVTFNVNATTYYGENIYLTGSTSELGEWRTGDALAMSAANYTSSRPLWSAEVELPNNSTVQYHYLRQEDDGSWVSETQNRTFTVPVCANANESGTSTTVEDAWVGPSGTPKTTTSRTLRKGRKMFKL